MDDERFSHLATDHKFRRLPKGKQKVQINKRFQGAFKDEKFKVKYKVDKRGRPVNRTATDDLKKYYELSSDEDEEGSDSAGSEVQTNEEADEKDLKLKDGSDKVISDKVKDKLKNLKVDYARGEGALLSDSSSDDEESEEEVIEEGENIDHKWGELDGDAERTDEATSRLAACNMDWDRIRAIDLMVLFNSFLPAGGSIKSVLIYPSEFGKERMKEEEVKGPIELVEMTKEEKDEAENEEGAKYHMEKLRQYQLNRLKYFYAVISFNNADSANKIYTECDGMEYESSATKIDLRFIPEDMTFDDDPKEVCDKLPDTNKYKPRFFTTTALQQAKVDLTWDETNPDRIEMTEKLASGKIDEIDEADLQAYLASSSGEESEEEVEEKGSEDEEVPSDPLDKYKALLQEIESKEKEKENNDIEMEITWGISAEEQAKKMVQKKMAENENKTPFEQYLQKRKDKRKEKRDEKKKSTNDDYNSDPPSDIDMNDPYFAEEFNKPEFKTKSKPKKVESEPEDEEENKKETAILNLLFDEETDGKKHFNVKKIVKQEKDKNSKKKKKHQKAKKQDSDDDEPGQTDFKADVNDKRFSAVFTNHLFNIDTSDPKYKSITGMDDFVKEKLKRRTEEDDKPAKKAKKNSTSTELNVLVKSVKRNIGTLKKK